MRSTNPQAPAAVLAIFGVAAFLMLAAAILALYILGPREFRGVTVAETPTRVADTPDTPAATSSPVPSDTLAPIPTLIPTSTATRAPSLTPTRPRPSATPVPPTRVNPTATAVPPTQSVTVDVYFVALGDNGASGLPLGCGDSLIALPRQIPAGSGVAERIAAALTALLSTDEEFVGEQRYYNALFRSDLMVNSVTLDGTTATVQLSGDVELGDDCNRPRIEGQIEGTVSAFAEVDAVQVFVNGTPLETLLYVDQ